MPSGGMLGPCTKKEQKALGAALPLPAAPGQPASGTLANHDPPLPCLHAYLAWTSTRLATLSENPASNLGTTCHPLHWPEKVAVLTPARPEPPTTPAPSRGLCPGHGAPYPAHRPASRLPVPQQPDDPPLHHPPNGHSSIWGSILSGREGKGSLQAFGSQAPALGQGHPESHARTCWVCRTLP